MNRQVYIFINKLHWRRLKSMVEMLISPLGLLLGLFSSKGLFSPQNIIPCLKWSAARILPVPFTTASNQVVTYPMKAEFSTSSISSSMPVTGQLPYWYSVILYVYRVVRIYSLSKDYFQCLHSKHRLPGKLLNWHRGVTLLRQVRLYGKHIYRRKSVPKPTLFPSVKTYHQTVARWNIFSRLHYVMRPISRVELKDIWIDAAFREMVVAILIGQWPLCAAIVGLIWI